MINTSLYSLCHNKILYMKKFISQATYLY